MNTYGPGYAPFSALETGLARSSAGAAGRNGYPLLFAEPGDQRYTRRLSRCGWRGYYHQEVPLSMVVGHDSAHELLFTGVGQWRRIPVTQKTIRVPVLPLVRGLRVLAWWRTLMYTTMDIVALQAPSG